MIEPDWKTFRPTGRADHNGPDGVSDVDQNQSCRARPRLLAVTGATVSTTPSAQAKGFGWGVGAGLVGAAVVGGAIAANNGYYYDGYYYRGYRHCGWVRQFDIYGNYIGRIRTCNY